MITKNHKTTTVLVALAALSAILVAGSVAAVNDHSAFAHKKGVKNSGIAVPTITAQQQKCTCSLEEPLQLREHALLPRPTLLMCQAAL